MISQQRIAFGHTTPVGPPKTAASRRTIALDKTTVRLLRLPRRLQAQEVANAGHLWFDTGVRVHQPVRPATQPDFLTRRFRYLVAQSGLPPVRLAGSSRPARMRVGHEMAPT
jgi:hypothetical protein